MRSTSAATRVRPSRSRAMNFANRSAPPEDLIPQFGLIRHATRAFNLPCIEKEGFEADDLIATYTRLAEQAGASVTIISSDKDLMQLVTPNVSMYD
eukprot:gene7032-8731_t